MQNNMVPSRKIKEGEVYDLIDYQFAREVVKSHPRIISVYTKLLPVLYVFAAYQCVWPVIQTVEDSKLLAEMQLEYYKKIYDTKGLVKSEKK